MTSVIKKWLFENNKKVCPKTYTSCVFDSNGQVLEGKLLQSIIYDTTIRYDEETDYIQVFQDGSWKNTKRAFQKFFKTDLKNLMLSVTGITGGGYVQFSELRFRNSSDEIYSFGTVNAFCSDRNTDGDLKNGVDGDLQTKICVSFTDGVRWWYKIQKNSPFDLQNFPIFEIVNASDTQTYGRIPTSFKLSFSPDGLNWITMLEEKNITPLSIDNFAVAYQKDLSDFLQSLI